MSIRHNFDCSPYLSSAPVINTRVCTLANYCASTRGGSASVRRVRGCSAASSTGGGRGVAAAPLTAVVAHVAFVVAAAVTALVTVVAAVVVAAVAAAVAVVAVVAIAVVAVAIVVGVSARAAAEGDPLGRQVEGLAQLTARVLCVMSYCILPRDAHEHSTSLTR